MRLARNRSNSSWRSRASSSNSAGSADGCRVGLRRDGGRREQEQPDQSCHGHGLEGQFGPPSRVAGSDVGSIAGFVHRRDHLAAAGGGMGLGLRYTRQGPALRLGRAVFRRGYRCGTNAPIKQIAELDVSLWGIIW